MFTLKGTRRGLLKHDLGIYNGNLVYIAWVKKCHHKCQGSREFGVTSKITLRFSR